MTEEGAVVEPVAVSRRIEAPVAKVFAILADPAQHQLIDGSGMLRDPASATPITSVGDEFVFKMFNDEMGDYEMTNRVVVYQPDRAIAWAPRMTAATRPEDVAAIGESGGAHRWGYELEPDGPNATVVTEIFDCSESPEWLQKATKGGTRWLEAMSATLERLDEVATS